MSREIPRQGLLYEDLYVGLSFRSPGRTITDADVIGFAALTGDFSEVHTSDVYAKASQFGRRIAHGMLVVSLAAGLVPFDPGRVIALRRVADATFKRPVRLGDTHLIPHIIERGEQAMEAELPYLRRLLAAGPGVRSVA